jgi:hypothetical protein
MLATGAVVLTLLGSGTPSSATPAAGTPPSTSDEAKSTEEKVRTMLLTPAEEQAIQDKLNPAEEQALQARVDEYLKTTANMRSTGGKQVTINQIAFDHGVLTVPIPGIYASYSCRYTEACVYADTWFNGAYIRWIECDTLDVGGLREKISSVWNNQTSGTQTILYDSSWQIINATLAPSRTHDLGVWSGNKAWRWKVC